MSELQPLTPQGPCIAIDGEACLLAQNAASNCRQCADICPTEAIIIAEDGLGLAEEACVGCGQCAAICPAEAIAWPMRWVMARHGREHMAFARCRPAAGVDGQGVMPCLHAITLDQLLDAARNGVDRFVLGFGACDQCEARPKTGYALADRLKLMRRLLESRGFASPRAEAADGAAWQAQLAACEQGKGQGPALNRRSLFARVAPAAVSSGQLPPRQADSYLGLPRVDADEVVAFLPKIDVLRCSGCDACAKLCPTGAIRIEQMDGTSYQVDGAACNHCRLCVDVCADAAITLHVAVNNERQSIALSQKRCPACGARHHRPTAQHNDKDHCRICQKTNHYANLHQVIR